MRAVIIDLTRGEMASRGTPKERLEEARIASDLLGAACRENLDLGDTRLSDAVENRRAVAAVIRKHRPDVILAPWWEDRHPDHAAAGLLVKKAVFDSRLAKLDTGRPPFAPGLVLHYPGRTWAIPTFVVDVTGVFERKMEAVRAYRSQFPEGGKGSTVKPIGFNDYLWQIESRCRSYGSLIDVRYGEGFIAPEPLPLTHPGRLLPPRGKGAPSP